MADSTTRKRVEAKKQQQERGLQEVATAAKEMLYSEKTQQRVANIYAKIEPIFQLIGTILNIIAPYVTMCWDFINRVRIALLPYHLEELSEAALGLFLVMFGGIYMVLISAIEAYRQTGWRKTWNNLCEIYDHYLEVKAHYKKDDAVDANKDGIADVSVLGTQDLFTRKMLLILRVTDPVKLQKLIEGVWIGFCAVVAILRMKFAQTLILGAAIGDAVHEFAEKYLNPLALSVVPKEYSKWVPVCVQYLCKGLGMSVAFFVSRVIASVYAAVRGGRFIAFSVLTYGVKRGWFPSADPSSTLFTAIMFGCAAFGVLFQWATVFTVPFPLNLILFPVSLVETFLQYFLAYGPDVPSA